MGIAENLESIMAEPPAWLQTGRNGGIVVSSRIRLARNLAGEHFPNRMNEDQLLDVWRRMVHLLGETEELGDSVSVGMGELPGVSKQMLFERHLISREHLQRGVGSGIVMRNDEFLSVLVNEEDHLRIQSFQPGCNLKEAWARIDRVDSEIDNKAEYAFSPALGYLTCCPTNVGTGMRASVMLHLPALALLDEMRPVVNGVSKLGLMVRGLWGEGSDIAGNMFQISNQITLGKEEVEILDHLEHIVKELSEHEENARSRLVESHERLLRDHVGRAKGILGNAHILSSREALDLLSAVRLGVETGLIEGCGRESLDELLLFVQPAHLQLRGERNQDAEERDTCRARLVRSYLRDFGNRDRKQKEGDNE